MSPSYLLFNVCEVSRSMDMDKWFASNAVRLSHGSEGTKRPLIRLLLMFNNHNKSTSKSKHTDLPSAMRPLPHSEELPVLQPPENLTFIDDNSDSD